MSTRLPSTRLVEYGELYPTGRPRVHSIVSKYEPFSGSITAKT